MGWTDWLADKTKAGARILDPGGVFIGGSVPNQPGAVQGTDGAVDEFGAVKGGVKDPLTGNQIDPTTGTVYDKDGRTITDPNVAQQVARNISTSGGLLGRLGQATTQQQAAFNGQKSLLGSLDNTIAGTNPSVAQNQLTQGLGQIQRTQMAGAAGASGSSAFAARRAALANIGNASTATDQSSAILRAKEINDAQTAKAGVLNNIGNSANTQADQAISGGAQFANMAASGQAGQQGLNYDAAAQQNKDKKDTSNKILGLIGSLA